MGDMGDVYRALREDQKNHARTRREQAQLDFPVAQAKARSHGLVLVQRSETHYQLEFPDGALLNIYPGNRRLYGDRTRPRCPFVRLWDDGETQEFRLEDIVAAAAKAWESREAAVERER